MDGVIFIDKPTGLSSAGVVTNVKKMVKTKVGHGGTLDPNASGVLPLLIGEGTKFGTSSLSANKVYVAEVTLGVTTDTGDSMGLIIKEQRVSCGLNDIKKVVDSFVGGYLQEPPMFSAIKYKGKPLYKYAREGLTVVRKKRDVTVEYIKLLESCIPKIVIEVSCSKGTYIRTLAEDIGLKLGCGAHVASLKRTAVGSFTIEESVKLEDVSIDFAKLKLEEFKKKYLKPVDVFLEKLSSVYLSNEESKIIVNGGNIPLPFEFDEKFKEQEVKIYNVNIGFIGLGVTNERLLVPKRLVNLDKSVLR